MKESFRPARADDLGRMHELYLSTFSEPERRDWGVFVDGWKCRQVHFDVAEVAGEVAGFSIACELGLPGFLYWDYFGLAKHVRGNGMGRRFVNAVLGRHGTTMFKECQHPEQGDYAAKRIKTFVRWGAYRLTNYDWYLPFCREAGKYSILFNGTNRAPAIGVVAQCIHAIYDLPGVDRATFVDAITSLPEMPAYEFAKTEPRRKSCQTTCG